eukprot:9477637-Heterocapsa_arctica.AAC.1
MSVFADDLLILEDDLKIDVIRHTLDEDLKFKWTNTIGLAWTRCLGNPRPAKVLAWIDRGNGTYRREVGHDADRDEQQQERRRDAVSRYGTTSKLST